MEVVIHASALLFPNSWETEDVVVLSIPTTRQRLKKDHVCP